jgi:hypothetical protein
MRASPVTPAPAFSAVDIVDQAQANWFVLQDYRPLAESLEWELGQEYYRHHGSLAFISDPDPIPFLIHNDGNQSIRVAEVLFTSLVVSEAEGKLEDEIYVLEMGIGVGLFARYFLDWFQHLCDQAGKDYYDRLCYVAADRSPLMLRDAGRHGIFQNHPGRYRFRVADALCPARTLLADPDIARLAPRPFRAVFLNYVLSCLPPTVLKQEGQQVQQLHVRTFLPPGANWQHMLQVSPHELHQMAASPNPEQRRNLLAIYPLVLWEYQFRPVEGERIPFTDFAMDQVELSEGKPLLHNYGALICLEATLELLAEGGIILISDYGQPSDTAEEFQHQRFSQSTAVGINFPLLERYFSMHNRVSWNKPPSDDASVNSRLLMHRPQPEVVARFEKCFGGSAREWLDEPAKRAREAGAIGRLQAALVQYREALSRQPFSWVLMNEVAHFLTFNAGNPKAGLEMSLVALQHNPGCAAALWNSKGEILFLLGRLGEAGLAFERALEINRDDPRAHSNLALLHTQIGEYREALVDLAEGLAVDRAGMFREWLLDKQVEILGLLDQQNKRFASVQAEQSDVTKSRPIQQGSAELPVANVRTIPPRKDQ